MSKRFITATILALAVGSMAGAAAAESSVYAKAGVLGAGVGYGQHLSPALALRADVTTMGRWTRRGHVSDMAYAGQLRNDVATLYGDWFPFDNGFRFSLGLGLRQTHLKGHGRADRQGQITVGDVAVNYGPQDRLDAQVRWPTVAPYLGVGWSRPADARQGGWGWFADAGVYVGRPKTTLDLSDSLRSKLAVAASLVGSTAQAEISKQLDDIDRKARRLQLFPSIYVGLSYTF